MLEKITNDKFRAISKASPDALLVLDTILAENSSPVVAEVGIGIGATTLESPVAWLTEVRSTSSILTALLPI